MQGKLTCKYKKNLGYMNAEELNFVLPYQKF